MHNKTKVVAAFLDGRRLKGFLFDFSAVRGYFFLFPESDGEDQAGARGLLVRLAELKALFFVKEFAGNPGYKEQTPAHAAQPGEKVEVTFSDGETRIGSPKHFLRQPRILSRRQIRIPTAKSFVIASNVTIKTLPAHWPRLNTHSNFCGLIHPLIPLACNTPTIYKAVPCNPPLLPQLRVYLVVKHFAIPSLRQEHS
jgi:hypothetical protein